MIFIETNEISMKFKSILMLAVVAIMACSCNPQKEMTYLWDIDNMPEEHLNIPVTPPDLLVKPGDRLSIIITGLNKEAIEPFNRAKVISEAGGTSTGTNANDYQYYLVDNKGCIDFPVIGTLNILGMNKAQIKELLLSKLCPKYLNEQPAIEIRWEKFKVTVLGDLGTGQKESNGESMNIFELLAKSGDLNITALRENILLIRTKPDGTREKYRINLHDRDLLISSNYWLEQNDIIYVQANKTKARSSWAMPPAWGASIGVFSFAVSLATMIIALCK